MTVKDSRVERGKLTLTLLDADGKPTGTPLDISCQSTSVAIKTKVNEGSSQQVLCGDVTSTGGTTDYTLDVTNIQDFDDPQGFVLWCLAHDGDSAQFEWLPNDKGTCPTFSQNVVVRPIDIGGNVGVQNTGQISWPLAGKPKVTMPTPPAPAK